MKEEGSMGNTAKKPEDMTWADIRATLAEATLLSKENEIRLKKLEESIAKTEKAVAETTRSVFGMNQELKGISDSNGMMAEEYFYNSLDESMSFGGYHFDSVDRNRKRKCRDKDGNPIQTEYDVLMTNADASCIVEVKYRARRDHIEDLLEKVGKFRLQFANCANHKIILGIAALSFDDGVENEAKKLGMGILKLNGDAVEVYDKNLKVY